MVGPQPGNCKVKFYLWNDSHGPFGAPVHGSGRRISCLEGSPGGQMENIFVDDWIDEKLMQDFRELLLFI